MVFWTFERIGMIDSSWDDGGIGRRYVYASGNRSRRIVLMV